MKQGREKTAGLAEMAGELGLNYVTIYRLYKFLNPRWAPGSGNHMPELTPTERRQLRALHVLSPGSESGFNTDRRMALVRRRTVAIDTIFSYDGNYVHGVDLNWLVISEEYGWMFRSKDDAISFARDVVNHKDIIPDKMTVTVLYVGDPEDGS